MKERGDVPRALGHGYYFNSVNLRAVENQICGYRPEKDGIVGQVFPGMTESGCASNGFKRFEEFSDPAICGVDVVLSDEFPNLVKVPLRINAQDIPFHARSFLR